MKIILRTLLVAIAALTIAATAFAQTDVEGSKDYPGIARMPNTFILTYGYLKFDAFNFTVATVHNQDKTQSVEGEKTFIRYKLKDGAEPTSPLQKLRNYENAARAAGGQVVWEYINGASNAQATLKLHQGSSEIWVYLNAAANAYELTIIAKQAMAQEVTIDAAAMASSLADTGSVAIYGINFDTAKSDIKPESAPTIEQIAKMLTSNPTLKVGIVGHTDMVGDATSNMKLSQARAQSVITELVSKHGIAAARLVAFGAGPWSPLASNKTDDGRAKNGRVELVEIATRTEGKWCQYGHVYQGRYKSLPVEPDDHFLALVRYGERNAKRATLVRKAEDWPWSSAHVRLYGNKKQRRMLSSWPVAAPEPYWAWLNQSQGKEEIAKIRDALRRSKPYGSEKWVAKAVAQCGGPDSDWPRVRPPEAPIAWPRACPRRRHCRRQGKPRAPLQTPVMDPDR